MNLVRFRIVFSLFIAILFLILFLNGEQTVASLSCFLLSFQFVPALIKAISNPGFMVVSGLISLLVITLLFGRVYCSFLCPLGVMQDLSIAISRRFGWRKNHSFQKPRNWLRYSMLALTIILAVSGSLVLVNLLDPYSLTGRIINHILEPSFAWLYNVAGDIPKFFHIYLPQKETAYIPPLVLVITLIFFLGILFISARYGRLYCNTMCPMGSVLGLISRFSIFKFTLDKNYCTECLRCETVCKSGCINPDDKIIDITRCVACFNCFAACPQPAIKYQYASISTAKNKWSPQRRGFVIGSTAAIFSVLLVFNDRIRMAIASTLSNHKTLITPPGSLNLQRFTQFCTACHLCVSACPTKVLTPSFFDYGITGILQPKMNYEKSFCDYNCNACGQVCPTEAITRLTLEDKKLVQIGKVELLKNRCIVYVDKRNCGACGEVCPTRTINFTNKQNILYPEVDVRYCIGCGACELACPTTPKSIIVEANEVHQTAVKYRHRRRHRRGQMTLEGFPF